MRLPAADVAFLHAAADLLPLEPWSDATWQEWATALARAAPRKGKALYQPLRLALTGLAHGPEMRVLLPLLGREQTAERLRAVKKA